MLGLVEPSYLGVYEEFVDFAWGFPICDFCVLWQIIQIGYMTPVKKPNPRTNPTAVACGFRDEGVYEHGFQQYVTTE